MKYCKHCGTKLNDNARFCFKCGKSADENVSERQARFEKVYIYDEVEKKKVEPKRHRVISCLFALLLGTLGMQHFYNGHVALGVLCILFCWTGIPTLVGIINGIQYACCDSDEEFTKKYCVNYA